MRSCIDCRRFKSNQIKFDVEMIENQTNGLETYKFWLSLMMLLPLPLLLLMMTTMIYNRITVKPSHIARFKQINWFGSKTNKGRWNCAWSVRKVFKIKLWHGLIFIEYTLNCMIINMALDLMRFCYCCVCFCFCCQNLVISSVYFELFAVFRHCSRRSNWLRHNCVTQWMPLRKWG